MLVTKRWRFGGLIRQHPYYPTQADSILPTQMDPSNGNLLYLEGTLDRRWISGMDLSSDQKHLLLEPMTILALIFGNTTLPEK